MKATSCCIHHYHIHKDKKFLLKKVDGADLIKHLKKYFFFHGFYKTELSDPEKDFTTISSFMVAQKVKPVR